VRLAVGGRRSVVGGRVEEPALSSFALSGV